MEITLSDFQAHCSQYLLQMKEDLIITNKGRPLARIEPADLWEMRVASSPDVIDQFKELRKGHRLGKDMTIKQRIEDGRL